MSADIAVEYAKAIVQATESRQALAQVESDLHDLEQMLAAHNELRQALHNPAVHAEARRSIVDALGRACDWSAIGQRAIAVLVERRRTQFIAAIRAGLWREVSEVYNTQRAEVLSAQELTSEERVHLAATLSEGLGVEVDVEFRVDSSLVAGSVTRLSGGRVIDSSFRGQLERAAALLGARDSVMHSTAGEEAGIA